MSADERQPLWVGIHADSDGDLGHTSGAIEVRCPVAGGVVSAGTRREYPFGGRPEITDFGDVFTACPVALHRRPPPRRRWLPGVESIPLPNAPCANCRVHSDRGSSIASIPCSVHFSAARGRRIKTSGTGHSIAGAQQRLCLQGPSAAWIPQSSLQGRIYGVPRQIQPLLRPRTAPEAHTRLRPQQRSA